MTIERGVDPRGLVLLPFGGAGPLHAAALAEQLGISRLLCPRASGVLSALGLAAAAPRRDHARSVLLRGDSLTRRAPAGGARGAAGAARPRRSARPPCAPACATSCATPDSPSSWPSTRSCPRRCRTRAAAPPAGLGPEQLRAAFAREHERRYGYSDPAGELELVTMRISVWGPAPRADARGVRRGRPGAGAAGDRVRGRGRGLAGVPWRARRRARAIAGPALWALPEATLLVPPGWRGEVDRSGNVLLERDGAGGAGRR